MRSCCLNFSLLNIGAGQAQPLNAEEGRPSASAQGSTSTLHFANPGTLSGKFNSMGRGVEQKIRKQLERNSAKTPGSSQRSSSFAQGTSEKSSFWKHGLRLNTLRWHWKSGTGHGTPATNISELPPLLEVAIPITNEGSLLRAMKFKLPHLFPKNVEASADESRAPKFNARTADDGKPKQIVEPSKPDVHIPDTREGDMPAAITDYSSSQPLTLQNPKVSYREGLPLDAPQPRRPAGWAKIRYKGELVPLQDYFTSPLPMEKVKRHNELVEKLISNVDYEGVERRFPVFLMPKESNKFSWFGTNRLMGKFLDGTRLMSFFGIAQK